MSQGAVVTQRNIRKLIDDMDKESYAISSIRLANLVQNRVQTLSRGLLQPLVSSPPSPLAISAGVYDYTVSGAVASVRQIIRDSDGGELHRRTMEQMNLLYMQDSSTPAAPGPPDHYALDEVNTQVFRIRIGRTPAVGDTLNVYKSTFPASGSGDTSAIPLSDAMIAALELSCAASCVLLMSPKDRERRMLGKEIVADWQAQVERAIHDENWQQASMSRQETVDEVEL